tara:strand:+ start:487 stop:672 length:186 start_codon:yes stop_codon:yes gene_type:complete
MRGEYLQAYQSFVEESKKIKSTKIMKVSYLLKLKAQRNCISNLDIKHKAWGKNEFMNNTLH